MGATAAVNSSIRPSDSFSGPCRGQVCGLWGKWVVKVEQQATALLERIRACFLAVLACLARPFSKTPSLTPEQWKVVAAFQNILTFDERADYTRLDYLVGRMTNSEKRVFLDGLSTGQLAHLWRNVLKTPEQRGDIFKVASGLQKFLLFFVIMEGGDDVRSNMFTGLSLDQQLELCLIAVEYRVDAEVRHQLFVDKRGVALRLFEKAPPHRLLPLFDFLPFVAQLYVCEHGAPERLFRIMQEGLKLEDWHNGDIWNLFTQVGANGKNRMFHACRGRDEMQMRMFPQLAPEDRAEAVRQLIDEPPEIDTPEDPDAPEGRFVCPIGREWMRDPVFIMNGLVNPHEDPNVGNLAHVPLPRHYFERSILARALRDHLNRNPMTNEEYRVPRPPGEDDRDPVRFANGLLLQGALFRYLLEQRRALLAP